MTWKITMTNMKKNFARLHAIRYRTKKIKSQFELCIRINIYILILPGNTEND